MATWSSPEVLLICFPNQIRDDGGEKVKWNLLKKYLNFKKKRKKGAEKKNQCLVITELVTH